jgi:hypothetical protein
VGQRVEFTLNSTSPLRTVLEGRSSPRTPTPPTRFGKMAGRLGLASFISEECGTLGNTKPWAPCAWNPRPWPNHHHHRCHPSCRRLIILYSLSLLQSAACLLLRFHRWRESTVGSSPTYSTSSMSCDAATPSSYMWIPSEVLHVRH